MKLILLKPWGNRQIGAPVEVGRDLNETLAEELVSKGIARREGAVSNKAIRAERVSNKGK